MSRPLFDDQPFSQVGNVVLAVLVLLAGLLIQCGKKKKQSNKARLLSRKSSKSVSAAKLKSSQKTVEGVKNSEKQANKSEESKPEPGDKKDASIHKPNIEVEKKKEKPKESPEEEYPEVPEPTPSAKKKREKALEDDKKAKIQKGFYQSKSDEDDTLEPIKSLKEERTDDAVNQSTKKAKKASLKNIKK